jgi:hypothetical protein
MVVLEFAIAPRGQGATGLVIEVLLVSAIVKRWRRARKACGAAKGAGNPKALLGCLRPPADGCSRAGKPAIVLSTRSALAASEELPDSQHRQHAAPTTPRAAHTFCPTEATRVASVRLRLARKKQSLILPLTARPSGCAAAISMPPCAGSTRQSRSWGLAIAALRHRGTASRRSAASPGS